MNKFYYLYKITNWINGKIYIGVHSTNNLNDGYMGSGTAIKAAIKKYGIGYFTKEILEQFNSIEEMYIAEKIIVDEEFINDKMTYNCMTGGSGGWGKLSQETCSRISNSKLNKILSYETKLLISKRLKAYYKDPLNKEKISASRKGRKLTEEHKKNISKALENRPVSEETRQKLRLKNSNISEETRQKLSEAAKKRFTNQEERDKISKSLMGHVISEETKKKISNTLTNKK